MNAPPRPHTMAWSKRVWLLFCGAQGATLMCKDEPSGADAMDAQAPSPVVPSPPLSRHTWSATLSSSAAAGLAGLAATGVLRWRKPGSHAEWLIVEQDPSFGPVQKKHILVSRLWHRVHTPCTVTCRMMLVCFLLLPWLWLSFGARGIADGHVQHVARQQRRGQQRRCKRAPGNWTIPAGVTRVLRGG